MLNINNPAGCERILVAIDGDTPSQWAVQVARQFAEQLNARVRLVHVAEPALPVYEDFAASLQIETRREQFGLDLLKRTRICFPPRLAVDSVLRTGLPFEEITAEAKQWKATLIVVGTHGRNRLTDFILGSTSEAVLRRSPCPVIVVGHEPRWTPAQAIEEVRASVRPPELSAQAMHSH